MYLTLVILILVVCFLLALVVLAQNPKGGGLSSQFGAGGAANLMGVKRTGDLLEKLTWGFAVGLIVLALATHMLGGGAGPVRSVNQQAAQKTALPAAPAPTTPAAPAPGAPAAQQPTTPAPQPTPAN
ncbi:preprotein translocase subunit SecG [Hymenobacter sp. HMF4947]|uniref:Protein-export membrane protein SecG n=1 Tax=Hymenobacter ginkgonis TaxID=2682976 RepID=A0A7K1TGW4_9BACT|nr:preprotein translocase subunit SecG [Hymenobacter ginkgonis]MVN77657.1 preprotein translocase subunit SecG [Hymenobacter ginkgonis]